MTEGNAEGSSIPPLTPDLARRDRNAHSRRRRAASGLLFGSRAPGDAVVVFPVKGVVVWTPAEVEAWHDVPHAFITTALREGRTLSAAVYRSIGFAWITE